MVKKVGVKKTKTSKTLKIDDALMDNFVSLQKVLTNLAIKLDGLTDQVSKLLNLFEISAKNFAEKQAGKGVKDKERDREFLEKLDSLMEQNKTIARGLTLMEQKVRDKNPETDISRVPRRKLPRY